MSRFRLHLRWVPLACLGLACLGPGSRKASAGDLPVVTVTASDSSATESRDKGVFRFRRTGDTSAALRVAFSRSGTASLQDCGWVMAHPMADETPNALYVDFPAGAGSADVVLTATRDNLLEGTETVTFTIGGGSYVVGSPASATAYILNLTPVLPIGREPMSE